MIPQVNSSPALPRALPTGFAGPSPELHIQGFVWDILSCCCSCHLAQSFEIQRVSVTSGQCQSFFFFLFFFPLEKSGWYHTKHRLVLNGNVSFDRIIILHKGAGVTRTPGKTLGSTGTGPPAHFQHRPSIASVCHNPSPPPGH